MEDGTRFTRKQFLAALGSMVLTAAVARVASLESTLTAITHPKRPAGYGSSVYGGGR
jgi:hypothetical protein